MKPKAKKLPQHTESVDIGPIAEYHERKIAEAREAKTKKLPQPAEPMDIGPKKLPQPAEPMDIGPIVGYSESVRATRPWPNYLRGAIEARNCRHCGALKGRLCIDPRAMAVFVTVNFDDATCAFCYERVFDYFESHRPVVPEATQ
jgi:hypothetical protein